MDTSDAPPGLFERIGTGFQRMGHTIYAGAEVLSRRPRQLAAAALAPEGKKLAAARDAGVGALQDVMDPAKRRELERGVDNMVTLGYGQRIAARAGNALGDVERGTSLNETRRFAPGLFTGNVQGESMQEAADRAAAPGFQEAGTLLGIASPGVANAAGAAGGNLVRMATAAAKPASLVGRTALGGLRGVAGYELSAPVVAAASADAEGKRLDALREAATDPAGIVLAGAAGSGSGALQRLTETAPARVAKRRAADITTGEQNAGIKITRKVQERAGEEGERLSAVLADDPELEKLVSVKAGSNPGKVHKAVTSKIEQVNDELDEMYDAMEKAGRVVTPTDIAVAFDKLLGQRLKAGDAEQLAILRRARANFLNEYGNFGKLSAETLQIGRASCRERV